MLLTIDDKDVVGITELLANFRKVIEDLNQTAETLMYNFNLIKRKANLLRDNGMRRKKHHKIIRAGNLENHYLSA